jgi:hypothetical protein
MTFDDINVGDFLKPHHLSGFMADNTPAVTFTAEVIFKGYQLLFGIKHWGILVGVPWREGYKLTRFDGAYDPYDNPVSSEDIVSIFNSKNLTYWWTDSHNINSRYLVYNEHEEERGGLAFL